MLEGRLMSFLIRVWSFVEDELELFVIFQFFSHVVVMTHRLNALQSDPVSLLNALEGRSFVI
jgi:hypothetical protein